MLMQLDCFDWPRLLWADKCWMALNPNICEQNARQILKVWRPMVQSFKYPKLLAFYCSFYRAQQLAACAAEPSNESDVWTAMATLPSVIQFIAQKAGIALVAQDWVDDLYQTTSRDHLGWYPNHN